MGSERKIRSRITVPVIGFVHNTFEEGPLRREDVKDVRSIIEVYPAYREGLYRISEYEYLNVIFNFNRNKGYRLKGRTPHWGIRGVFACCSPYRPSTLGLTRVRFVKRRGNRLTVTGLDALNNTPVVDIKPSVE